MRLIKMLILVAVAGILSVAPGCGGGDGDDLSSTAGPTAGNGGNADAVYARGGTKAEFIEAADAICRKGDEEMQIELETYLVGDGGKAKQRSEEVVTDVLVPGLEEQIRKVGALEPPAGDRKQIEAILVSLEQEVDRAEAAPWEFSQRQEPFAKPEALAGKYGLAACGGP